MTFSLLAASATEGAGKFLGGVAATGNLCVGSWVLRAAADVGISASQGKLPSTILGDASIRHLAAEATAENTVAELTAEDKGRDYRQLAVLDAGGKGAIFSGNKNDAVISEHLQHGLAAAGNSLANENVLHQLVLAYQQTSGNLGEKLLAALEAAQTVGGDSRGLLSAALLIVSPDLPPLSLRVDYDEQPVQRLRALYEKTRQTAYTDWLQALPTANDPQRHAP